MRSIIIFCLILIKQILLSPSKNKVRNKHDNHCKQRADCVPDKIPHCIEPSSAILLNLLDIVYCLALKRVPCAEEETALTKTEGNKASKLRNLNNNTTAKACKKNYRKYPQVLSCEEFTIHESCCKTEKHASECEHRNKMSYVIPLQRHWRYVIPAEDTAHVQSKAKHKHGKNRKIKIPVGVSKVKEQRKCNKDKAICCIIAPQISKIRIQQEIYKDKQ